MMDGNSAGMGVGVGESTPLTLSGAVETINALLWCIGQIRAQTERADQAERMLQMVMERRQVTAQAQASNELTE